MNKYIYILVLMIVPALSQAASLENIRINGFLSQGYLITTDNNTLNAETEDGTLEFNEAAVTLNTQISDKLRLGIQALSRDLGYIGNNEVTIDWALADYRYANWLGLRVGKMKLANGLYNQVLDVDAARTLIFMPTPLYNENFRETTLTGQGVGLYGYLPGGIEYTLTYTVATISEDGAVIRRINEDDFVNYYGLVSDPTVKACPSLQIFWNTPLEGLKLGGGAYKFDLSVQTAGNVMPPSEIQIILNRHTASLEYSWEKLVFAAEYVGGTTELRDKTAGRTIDDHDSQGYYAMLTYRFTELLEMGTAYSQWFVMKDDKDNHNYHKDLTLTARFDITDNWIFKLEGHAIRGIAEVDTSTPQPEAKWFMFASKLSYSF